MIRINNDYIIDIDEYNYMVKKDMHCIRMGVRFETKGIYGSLEKALDRVHEEIIKDKLKDGEHSLGEALQIIRECTEEWRKLCEGVLNV